MPIKTEYKCIKNTNHIKIKTKGNKMKRIRPIKTKITSTKTKLAELIKLKVDEEDIEMWFYGDVRNDIKEIYNLKISNNKK